MEPAFYSSRSQFTVTFRNLNIGFNEANNESNEYSLEELLLAAIRENPKISQRGFAEKYGFPRITIQRTIEKLTLSGKLERIGGPRGY